MRRLILLLMVTISAYASINSSHPRIMLDSTLVDTLKAYQARNTTEWAALKAWCDTWLYSAQGSYMNAGYQGMTWHRATLNYALAYQATGNETYANEAIIYLRAMMNDNCAEGSVGDGLGGVDEIQTDAGWVARTIGSGLATGRDWLDGADNLTTDLIDSVNSRLDQWITWYESNGYARNIEIDNYYAGYFTMVYTAAIGLYGDTNYKSSWWTKANTMWDSVKTYIDNDGLLDRGDWYEGWNYGPWATREYLQYVRSLETGTDTTNIWGTTNWGEDIIKSWISQLYPDRGYISDNGSWSGDTKGDPRSTNLLMLAGFDALNDTLQQNAEWFAENLTREPNEPNEWEAFLFKNNSIATAIPDSNKFNLFYYTNIGHLLSRSDWWDNTDATFVDFMCTNLKNGMDIAEDERNAGEVKIASRGELLITDGDTWEDESSYANVPRVTGSHTYAPNQEWWHYNTTMKYEGINEIYTYSKANHIDNAYDGSEDNNPSLSYYSRSIVHLIPDFIVVYDNLQATSSGNEATFRWYYNGSPTVNGQEVKRTVNNAQIFTKFIGQAGTVSTPVETAGSRTGMYYIDFDPTGTPINNQLITFFETADATQSAMNSSTQITESSSKMTGLHIPGTSLDWITLFTASTTGADVSGNIEFSFSPTGTTTNCILADLPSGSYSITSSGTSTKTVSLDASGSDYTVSDNGVLAFAVAEDNSVSVISSSGGGGVTADTTPPSGSLNITSTAITVTGISSDTDSSWVAFSTTRWDTIGDVTTYTGSSNINQSITTSVGTTYYAYWKATDDSSNTTYFSQNEDSVVVSSGGSGSGNNKHVLHIWGFEE